MTSPYPYPASYQVPPYGYHSPTYDANYGGQEMSLSVSQSSGSSYNDFPRSAQSPYSNASPRLSQRDRLPPSNAKQLDDIELKIAPSVATQRKKGKSGRTSSIQEGQTPAGQASYPCLWDGCEFITSRPYDLKRHANGHSKLDTFPCPYSWCSRDTEPFTRRDHLKVHLRTVHMKDIPKTGGIHACKKPVARNE